MSITDVFLEAMRTLGVEPAPAEPAPDAATEAARVKQAYRRALMRHPPDRDPDGFRRVRDAYELLTDPGARAGDLLRQSAPFAPPPEVPRPAERDPRSSSPVALLRLLAAQLDAAALEQPPPKPRAPRAASARKAGP